MLLLPSITLTAAVILGIANPQFHAAVFQAAMPPMVTPAIMLMEARIATQAGCQHIGDRYPGRIYYIASLGLFFKRLLRVNQIQGLKSL